ncbi:glycosyltransferase [Pedobacter sp. MR2016-24]|uniref:glycosyltransferase n=1 Tax=Pedobacter sp. MR2016-24 TaxID=2994466 RepID=UPI0022482E41|nr:glycosyltransferase [Pedobacter sp. MR2016-24]MCX2483524.1 hypothetical protein [Pedobacter sp. MR2016-24]
MNNQNSVAILATTWGSKHGGINAFSTNFCKALANVAQGISIHCVVTNATEDDISDACESGVTIVNLNIQGEEMKPEYAPLIKSLLIDTHKLNIIWWVGHDIITGETALKCKYFSEGKLALFMHMSYDDYGYSKYNTEEGALSNSDKVEKQKLLFKSADERFAVGPLLEKRMRELADGATVTMVVPGLAASIHEPSKKDRVSAISFGRYNKKESLTKQGPLAIAAYAHSVKVADMAFIQAIKDSDLTVIGIEGNLIQEMREVAAEIAGRVVHLKPFPFLEDQIRLQSLIKDCNLCLMLSWHEGFGLTAWEAISAAIPVVISENSGVYMLLKNLGGAALGCIHSVNVKGNIDGSPNEFDVDSVSSKIREMASDIPNAISNAISLRTFLQSKGYNWNNCAATFCKKLNIDIVVHSPITNYLTVANTLDGFDLTQALRILESARKDFLIGRYSDSLESLTELRKFGKTMKFYPIDMDSLLLEGEIAVRQNEYPKAKAIISRIKSEASEASDFERYVKAKFIENVIYRDQGEYGSAIKSAEETVEIIEQKLNDEQLLESAYRKLSRSLSLGGNWRTALEYGVKASEMARKKGLNMGECTSSFAVAEAYRHGLDFDNAKTWYSNARDEATKTANTDCYIWSALGLADTHFLTQENPMEPLTKLQEYLNKYNNSYPIEKLHVELSIYAARVRFENLDTYPADLIKLYEDLGINWPKSYIKLLLEGDFSNPKKF